jgi:hypothetical protein
MEWLKERQASHSGVPPARAPAATPELEAAAAPAAPAPGPGVPPPPPPAEPSSRQGQILAALTAAGTQGLRPAEVRQVTGIPQGTVASTLHGLRKRGQVRKVHDRYVATRQARASEP